MKLDLSKSDLIILCSALECYSDEMARRKRSTDYLFQGYSIEKRKQLAEENRVLLSARIEAVHKIAVQLHTVLLDQYTE